MNRKVESGEFTDVAPVHSGGAAVADRPRRRKTRAASAIVLRARVAIMNGLSDEGIFARLSDFGFDRDRLLRGRELCDRLRAAMTLQRNAAGKQHGSTERLRAGRDEAGRLFAKTLKLARLALADDPGARDALSLAGKRKRSLAAWLEQALTFYDNILEREDRVRALSAFNHDRACLNAERALVARVRTLNTEQELRKGDARAATAARRNAHAALNTYMRDYRTVIRLALHDKPAWRAKLGMG